MTANYWRKSLTFREFITAAYDALSKWIVRLAAKAHLIELRGQQTPFASRQELQTTTVVAQVQDPRSNGRSVPHRLLLMPEHRKVEIPLLRNPSPRAFRQKASHDDK